jgi:hypothetical protein
MALAVWLSLAFLVLAAGGSAVFAGVRGWRAYRAFRGFTGATTRALDDVLERAGQAEKHALAASRSSERLAEAATRLQEALAQLSILRAAAAEARAGLTFRLPTK